jgi:hypothetical protein
MVLALAGLLMTQSATSAQQNRGGPMQGMRVSIVYRRVR